MLSTDREAFTIIEMIVVIAIIGILGVFAYPKLIEFNRRWALDRFKNSTHETLRSAATRAMKSDVPVRVIVNIDANEIRFQQCKLSDRDECNDWEDEPWEDIQALTKLTAPDPVTIYQVGRGDFWSVESGTVEEKIDREGGSGLPLAIHLTTRPVPAQSNRCQFRTVEFMGAHAQVREYDYGQGSPFDGTMPDCAK
jgi:prepilin-type N-terminal cleavage/methylation domain-containing protein